MTDVSYDAIIIGAGIIGTNIGLELARKGYRTLNVDKLPAAGYGPTAESCAIIRVYYSTLDGSAMAYEGYFDWKNWPAYIGVEDERGLAHFHDNGTMIFKTERNGYLARILDICRDLDIPFEEWDRDRIATAFPFYSLDSYLPVCRPEDDGFGEPNGEKVSGAVFFPAGGYISDPQLATHNLQRAAEAAGGEFLFNVSVAEIMQDNGRAAGIRLEDGRVIWAPVVVNCAGAFSHKVNEMAGVTGDMTITTKPLRQEVVHVPVPDGIAYGRETMVTSDSDIGVYSRPELGSHILVGSEDPECDPREEVDPDGYDKTLSEQARIQALRYAQRVPELGIPNQLQGVVSVYDTSDDWIPIYDKSALPGFYMAIGTSGNQFKNAPVVGKMMAHLIAACEAGRDHDSDPVDFTFEHTGRTVSIGFYSRKRPINTSSSFSVLG